MISIGDKVSFNNKTWRVVGKGPVEEAEKEFPERPITKIMRERKLHMLLLERGIPRTLNLIIIKIHFPITTKFVFCDEKGVIYQLTDFKAEIDEALEN